MFHYRCFECKKMSEEEIEKTAALFSAHYGIWSPMAEKVNPKHVGHVKISSNWIKNNIINKPDRYVAMAFDQDRLIGHAFFLKRKIKKGNYITWILQLVVDKSYRGNDIGANLMRSIWGLSDSWAWGLFTANPSTIKALENVTMRKVNVQAISKHISEIREVAYDIFDSLDWLNSYNNGIVNTEFPVDHSDIHEKIHKYYLEKEFSLPENLPEGHEWLAFVFAEQKPKATPDQLNKLLRFSKEVIQKAYAEMHMESHSWASHTTEDADFLLSVFKNPSRILDVGCGQGRLTNELASRKIETYGIDMVEENIQKAKSAGINKAHFSTTDARKMSFSRKFNSVTCLYDVIGSFPKEEDNLRILEQIYKNMFWNGRLIISVMNMDLTRENCRKYGHVISGINKHIDKLLCLKGSDEMQKTGNVFNGRKILIDDRTGCCYRKEQFFNSDSLPIERVIVDRLYSIEGIKRLLNKVGFIVDISYCARAGHLHEPLDRYDSHAKEIVIVARKKGIIYKKRHRNDDVGRCWH